MDCILIKAKVVEREEVRVGMDEGGVELLQGHPGGGEGWTGGEERLHCSFMGQVGVPTYHQTVS